MERNTGEKYWRETLEKNFKKLRESRNTRKKVKTPEIK